MSDFINEITGQDEANRQARRLANRRPIQIDAGGLSTELVGPASSRRLRLTASPERQELVSGIRDVLSTGAADVRDLRVGVDSPLTRLNEAVQERIENARRRTIGDLSQNLRRRRVLGSSVAQDRIATAGAEFGRVAAEQEARSALQEIDIKTDLINQETQLASAALQTSLNELNLETELAASLATQFDQTLQRNQEQLLATLTAGAQGVGELIGTGVGTFTGIKFG